MEPGRRIGKAVAVVATVSMLVGAFAVGPADAKKKKKKKPPAVAACAPFVSEAAGDVKTTVITDAATAEAPVVVEVATDPGFGVGRPGGTGGDLVSVAYVPVQVDSAAAAAGLYASIHFTPAWDYDLYIDDPGGTEIAHSAGFFNQSSVAGAQGGSDIGSETLLGLESSDCTGYDVVVAGATTPGETVTLELYLGEAQAPPA